MPRGDLWADDGRTPREATLPRTYYRHGMSRLVLSVTVCWTLNVCKRSIGKLCMCGQLAASSCLERLRRIPLLGLAVDGGSTLLFYIELLSGVIHCSASVLVMSVASSAVMVVVVVVPFFARRASMCGFSQYRLRSFSSMWQAPEIRPQHSGSLQ